MVIPQQILAITYISSNDIISIYYSVYQYYFYVFGLQTLHREYINVGHLVGAESIDGASISNNGNSKPKSCIGGTYMHRVLWDDPERRA